MPLRPGVEIAASSRIVGATALDRVPIVFVGYGVVEPSLGYDPYRGVDVRGKIVVALAGDPDVEAGRDLGFGGRVSSPAARTKLAEAQKRGAAGFLTIHETFPASYRLVADRQWRRGAGLCAGHGHDPGGVRRARQCAQRHRHTPAPAGWARLQGGETRGATRGFQGGRAEGRDVRCARRYPARPCREP
ncbi:hypothetical protein QP162_09130 [Sphingomonas aurantiaca]|uniref:hypothetical protein n=1 Tax=Sphingomonas aurantiaca TaxID=185949 RepID=UPI002FE0D892